MSNPVVDTLLAILAAIFALAPQIIPGFKEWFDKLKPETKQLLQVGSIVGVGLALFGLACAGVLEYLLPGLPVVCSSVGFIEIVRSIIIAIAVNQGVYKGTKYMFRASVNA